MPREIYQPKAEPENVNEKLKQLEADNELLKGCIMELAEMLF